MLKYINIFFLIMTFALNSAEMNPMAPETNDVTQSEIEKEKDLRLQFCKKYKEINKILTGYISDYSPENIEKVEKIVEHLQKALTNIYLEVGGLRNSGLYYKIQDCIQKIQNVHCIANIMQILNELKNETREFPETNKQINEACLIDLKPRINFPEGLTNIILENAPYKFFIQKLKLSQNFFYRQGEYHVYYDVDRHDGVRFSTSNCKIAVVDQSFHIVKIFDTASGNLLNEFDLNKDQSVSEIKWIDENHLQIILSSQIKLTWDVSTKQAIQTVNYNKIITNRHGHIFNTILESPSKLKIAKRIREEVVIIYSHALDKKEMELKDQMGDNITGLIQDIDWSPCGTKLVSGSGTFRLGEHNIIIWDIKTGNALHVYPSPKTIDYVCWSADGQFIAAMHSEKETYIFDTNLNLLQTLDCRFLGWSNDSSMFACQVGNEVIIFQTGTFGD